MASAFGHAALIVEIKKLFPDKSLRNKALILGMVSSIIPDLDVICYQFGVDGTSALGHRGFTHSLVFALLWAFLLCWFFHKDDNSKKLLLSIYYFICTASHGVLDAMTTGGDGVTFFVPFSFDRFFLPWRFIEVSPIGASNFFSDWGLLILKNEFLVIVLPSLALFIIGSLANKYFYK